MSTRRTAVRRAPAAAAAGLALVLAACGGADPDDSPAARETIASGTPAPPEALAPGPSIRAGDDARTLLAASGDLDRLKIKVIDDLAELGSLHVEQTVSGSVGLRWSFDVDDTGRCSGKGVEGDTRYRFVTTADDRMLASPMESQPAWVEIPDHPLVASCSGGPMNAALATVNGDGRWWLFADLTRVGVEQVAGRRAVHFRKSDDGKVADSWIAADGATTRLVKLVRRDENGNISTSVFTEHDAAGPVAPEPSEGDPA
ncbi:MAG TPA: hypothetical protein VD864_00015 [Nocardioides sp.]|nr:hypothetical protein [Nocardioides sp.]